MEKSALNFNKEILFGEIGALIAAPLVSLVVSRFFSADPKIISSSAVFGAVLGASLFYLGMRIYDQKRQKTLSVKKFSGDLAYFTPVAFLLTLSVYYPTLYFLSNYLQSNMGEGVLISVIPSQIIAFVLFLGAINIYRWLLLKFLGKKL